MKKLDDKDSKTVSDGKKIIKHALNSLNAENISQAKEDFINAMNIFKSKNSVGYISVCLSFLGLTDYIIDRNNYRNSLALIHDGAYMADYSNSTTANLLMNSFPEAFALRRKMIRLHFFIMKMLKSLHWKKTNSVC